MGLDYEIVYKKGKENIVADALSRLPEAQNRSMINELSAVQPQWINEIMDIYTDDDEVQKIIEGLVVKDIAFTKFSYEKGLVRHEGKLYVGSAGDIRKNIIWELHDSPAGGHSGQDSTYKKIAMFFYWPKLRSEVNDYVRTCDIC